MSVYPVLIAEQKIRNTNRNDDDWWVTHFIIMYGRGRKQRRNHKAKAHAYAIELRQKFDRLRIVNINFGGGTTHTTCIHRRAPSTEHKHQTVYSSAHGE